MEKIKDKGKRGRSSELLKKRDENIVLRYYYYTEIERLRFDDSVDKVANEFYLKPFTVLWLLRRNSTLLDNAIINKTEKKELERKMPHLKF